MTSRDILSLVMVSGGFFGTCSTHNANLASYTVLMYIGVVTEKLGNFKNLKNSEFCLG